MTRGPLFDLQQASGATFDEFDGWELPAAFGSPEDELKAWRAAAGLADLSGRGVLRLRGASRLDFVQRMSTNDVRGLRPGQAAPTVFTTPIGRIVDLACVLPREDDLLLIVGRGADERVENWLRRHIFFNDKDYIPLEAGLKGAISFSKGCYVGQEIIARMDTYQRLAKRLVVLRMASGEWRVASGEVWADGSRAGQVTSVAPLAEGGALAALAYVRTAVAEPGRQLTVVAESGRLAAEIVQVSGENRVHRRGAESAERKRGSLRSRRLGGEK